MLPFPTVKYKESLEKIFMGTPINYDVADYIRYRNTFEKLPEGTGVCIDAGCGAGGFLEWIRKKGYTVVGLDTHNPGTNLRIETGDMTRMPFSHDYANAIVSIDSLYVEPEDAFKEFMRVLKPGGVVVIHAPLPDSKQTHILTEEFKNARTVIPRNESAVVEKRDYEVRHTQKYDTGELMSIAAGMGFVNIEQFPSWNPNEILAYDLQYLYRLLHPDSAGYEQEINSMAWLLASLPCEKPWARDYQIGTVTRCFK